MSDDLEKRLAALDQRIARTQAEVRVCVQELLTDDDDAFFIAERLPGLGSAVLPEVRKIVLDASHSATVRVLAAMVGFEVGDREESLSVLIEEIAGKGEFGPPAARRLAEQHIHEAEPAILAALRDIEISEIDAVVSYLEALHVLGARLPQEDRQRLACSGAWQITSALSQWHPT